MTIAERLQRYSLPTEGGCVEWQGHIKTNGYGSMSRRDGGTQLVHRIAWILNKGPIPGKLLVCHTCDNRRCVNLDHLFLGTHKDNTGDMVQKGRWVAPPVHAGAGHPRARLTETQVAEIRASVESASTVELAEKYGVSRSQIRRIVRGGAWSTGG